MNQKTEIIPFPKEDSLTSRWYPTTAEQVNTTIERRYRIGDIMSAIVCNFWDIVNESWYSTEQFFSFYEDNNRVYFLMLECLEYVVGKKLKHEWLLIEEISLNKWQLTIKDSRWLGFTFLIELEKNECEENMTDIKFFLQNTGKLVFSFIWGHFTPESISYE